MRDEASVGGNSSAERDSTLAGIPVAKVSAKRRMGPTFTRLWWLTLLCAVLAVVLVVLSLDEPGTEITIRFPEGHGLQVGDDLRYRGITVGTVAQVELADRLDAVRVGILLTAGHEKLAVEGSQFWIQRPRLQLGQIGGLDTVIGAKYVAVVPGPVDGRHVTEFDGLANPLGLTEGDWREIQISFPSGEGLDVGSPVRYRGIRVGEVTSIELTATGTGVEVGVRLTGAASRLASAGSQFWIERPRLDLTEVRGLDTLLTGHYIAMQPAGLRGDGGAVPLEDEFVGLAEAPPLPRSDGSLEVELDCSERFGLVRGAPVTYRGLEIGRVANVELATDSASVKVGVIIESAYTELIRDDSKWWVTSGLELDASLQGINVSIDSLSAWLRGGVAVATPSNPGKSVVTGHRFMLAPEPKNEWLSWSPRIATGGVIAAGNGDVRLPEAVRVVASWRASLLGLYRRKTVETWAIAMSDGTIRVPSTFVNEAAAAEQEVDIEMQGKKFSFTTAPKDGPSTVKITFSKSIDVPKFSTKRVSYDFNDKTVFLIVNPELSQPLALNGSRLAIEGSLGLRIAPGVPIADELTGSPVVNAETGDLYGLLVRGETSWVIAKIK